MCLAHRYQDMVRREVRRRRPAFSLTELLIVIAIIGVLMAIMLPAVFKVYGRKDEIVVANRERNAYLAWLAEPEELRGLQQAAVVRPPEQAEVVRDQFIVVLKDTVASPKAEADRIAKLGNFKIRHVYGSGRFKAFAANFPGHLVDQVKKDPSVKYVEQDLKDYICAQTVPTGVRRIGADRSSFRAGDGFGQVNATIAVIDTGIDASHPDLNVVLSRGFGHPTGNDDNGHGTHVAGSAAARDNGIGVVGTAPGARLWALKTLDANGAGFKSDSIAALNFITANADKVQVVNMSLGGAFLQAQNDAVDACVRAGVIVVIAAGNSSADASTSSPASAPLAITVAALADSDGLPGARGPATSSGPDDTFATFSNWGSVVDVIAPGVDILSTQPGNSLGVQSGTSMACPHVAGLVASIKSKNGAPVRNLRMPGGPAVTPLDVERKMRAPIRELIPGIYDSRTYPLITQSPF